jgi:hypothetical protein
VPVVWPVEGPVLCALAVPVVPVVWPVDGPVLCTPAVPVLPVVWPVLGPVLCVTSPSPLVPPPDPWAGVLIWVLPFVALMATTVPALAGMTGLLPLPPPVPSPPPTVWPLLAPGLSIRWTTATFVLSTPLFAP